MEKLSVDIAEEVLEIIPGGIYIFQDGRFVYVNPEISRISGYSAEELFQMNPFDLIVDNELKFKTISNTEKALSGEMKGLPPEQRVAVKCKDGKIKHVSLRPIPVMYQGKPAIMATVVDVTQEVSEKEKREKLEEFIRLTGKMLRHDVLNHLSAVTGYLEIYYEKREEKYLERAIKSAVNCVKTLKRLRELEWLIEEGKEMKEIPIKEVFESITPNRDVTVLIDGNCTVKADDGIYSIAENLIANAIEHGNCEMIKIAIRKKGEWCEVRVADNGRGIPDELKKRVFEEGFSSIEGRRGTGLFIVKRLMEKYGGVVWVEDNDPSGSVFVLRFRSAKC